MVAPFSRKGTTPVADALSGKAVFVRCPLRVRGPALTSLYKAQSYLLRACRGVPFLPPSVPTGRKFSTLYSLPCCAAPHGSYFARSGASTAFRPLTVQSQPLFVRACWPLPVPHFVALLPSGPLFALPAVHPHGCPFPGRLVVAPANGPMGWHSIGTVPKAETKARPGPCLRQVNFRP